MNALFCFYTERVYVLAPLEFFLFLITVVFSPHVGDYSLHFFFFLLVPMMRCAQTVLDSLKILIFFFNGTTDCTE